MDRLLQVKLTVTLVTLECTPVDIAMSVVEKGGEVYSPAVLRPKDHHSERGERGEGAAVRSSPEWTATRVLDRGSPRTQQTTSEPGQIRAPSCPRSRTRLDGRHGRRPAGLVDSDRSVVVRGDRRRREPLKREPQAQE